MNDSVGLYHVRDREVGYFAAGVNDRNLFSVHLDFDDITARVTVSFNRLRTTAVLCGKACRVIELLGGRRARPCTHVGARRHVERALGADAWTSPRRRDCRSSPSFLSTRCDQPPRKDGVDRSQSMQLVAVNGSLTPGDNARMATSTSWLTWKHKSCVALRCEPRMNVAAKFASSDSSIRSLNAASRITLFSVTKSPFSGPTSQLFDQIRVKRLQWTIIRIDHDHLAPEPRDDMCEFH